MLLWAALFFIIPYALLIGYYRWHWARLPQFVPTNTEPEGFVSVVIAARNEAHNLPNLLRALGRQTLPAQQFEIIIVDDYSTDDTARAVQPFLSARIRLITPQVAAASSSKKRAIEAGVAAAQGPFIAVTDADCTPQPHWLGLLLACQQQQGAAFVAAPVVLQRNGTLLGLFEMLDFMMLQGITAASVQAGALSMCNGANLGYAKTAFREVDGFAGVDARASGDDMLLLYKIWQRHPERIRYLKHAGAIMPTPVTGSWKAFWQQRIRWSSKATYYQDKRVSAVLFFVYAFNLWCLGLLAAALFKPDLWPLALGCLLAKTGSELLLLLPAARFYREVRSLWAFPLLQPLHLLYTVGIGIASQRRSYEWKGRKTR